jgi:spore coat protein U-like protein
MKNICFIFILYIGASFFIQAAPLCTASAPPVNLGTYDPINGNSVTFQINLNCNGNLSEFGIGNPAVKNSVLLSNNVTNLIVNPYSMVTGPIWGSTDSQILGCRANSFLSLSFQCWGDGDVSTPYPVTGYIKVPGGQQASAGTYTANFLFKGFLNNFDYTQNDVLYVPLVVTMQVYGTCSVSATPLTFNNYIGTQNTYSTAQINTTCTNNTSYSISIDAGNSNDINNRKMYKGVDFVNYFLSQDSDHTLNFGDLSHSQNLNKISDGTTQTTNVYGKIPSGQFPRPGNYSDSVNVTITY